MNQGRFSLLDAVLLVAVWAVAFYAGWVSLKFLAICISGWCGGALLEMAGTKRMATIGGLIRGLSGVGGTLGILAVIVEGVRRLF